MISKLFDLGALPRRLFGLSVVVLALGYGIVATPYGLFPVPYIRSAAIALVRFLATSGIRKPWYFRDTPVTDAAHVAAADRMSPGLTLVSGLTLDSKMGVKIVSAEGRSVHGWTIDWFAIWPDASHLPQDAKPKANPAVTHGMLLMPNGDLVFNFEDLGMVRMDPCGGVVWRLPRRTHHSVHLDENGHLWAPEVTIRHEPIPGLPNHDPPITTQTILEISPEGHVISETSLFDLLIQNGLRGLLHMSTLDTHVTNVSGDTMHVNDVETFPASLPSGVFRAGDVMVSIRNINTIVVFDPRSRRIKFMTVGRVLRQHDPDFVDGNTISVFDNNNLGVMPPQVIPGDRFLSRTTANGHFSRIVTISAKDESVAVRFAGSAERPFFTGIQGKHQLLPNGNLLIVEAVPGRVFEVDPGGRIVWEYFNLVGNGLVGSVTDAYRLPPALDESFFARAGAACAGAHTRHRPSNFDINSGDTHRPGGIEYAN